MNTKLPITLALIFLNATLLSAQIQSVKLKDGVERYYRPKTAGQKPWFFQQVENLFNVMLPAKDQLPFGVSVAFLVGVSQYDNLSPQLPFVKNDLTDMREFLLNRGGFDTVYVARERIVNRDLIEDYIRNKFGRWLNSRDRFLFYYAGHGADTGGKTGYMQFAGARAGNFAGAQVLAINAANDWCSEIKIAHLLFVFDCCASGLAFAPRGDAGEVTSLIATLSRNGSRVVMTAGTATEKTYEVETAGGKGNGVFTRAFLNAAATGLADKGSDGFMTIDEIYVKIKDEVARFSVKYKQNLTPKFWALEEAQYRGTFVFVNPEADLRRIALASEYAQPLNARPRGGQPAGAYGIIRLISYIKGGVWLDGAPVEDGSVDSGDEKYFYNVPAGKHTITVTGADEIGSENITVTKGQTTTVTIVAKAKQPPATVRTETPASLNKPAPPYPLRSERRDNLSEADVKVMLRQNNFYCREYDWSKAYSNPQGQGLSNDFEVQQGGKVVYDRATGLMWQQSGSPEYMTYEQAKAYVAQLKRDRFAGFSDWRLPTLEEAMSLMESKELNGDLYQ